MSDFATIMKLLGGSSGGGGGPIGTAAEPYNPASKFGGGTGSGKGGTAGGGTGDVSPPAPPPAAPASGLQRGLHGGIMNEPDISAGGLYDSSDAPKAAPDLINQIAQLVMPKTMNGSVGKGGASGA